MERPRWVFKGFESALTKKKKKKNQLGLQKIKIWRKLSSWAGGHTPILY